MKKNNFWTLAVFLLSTFVQAEIALIHMKGVHEAVSPHFQIELSPVNGYTLLKTPILLNRRLYGNYGPKNPKFGCMEKTNFGPLFSENNDCPQDENSELIQRLFPAHDRTLVGNQIPLDPISYLKPWD